MTIIVRGLLAAKLVTGGYGEAATESPAFEPLDAYPDPYSTVTAATVDTFAAHSRLRGS